MKRYTILVLVCLVGILPAPCRGQAPAIERTPVLLDTDAGLNGTFALGLILASPEIDLRGVTTVSGNTQQRAMMMCRFLTMTGRRQRPVAAGAEPQPARELGALYQYYYHPDILFNRTTKPVKESAVEFLHARLGADKGKITIIVCGPLTNLARLLKDKPEAKPWIKQVVWSDPSTAKDHDAAALRTVLDAGVPFLIVPTDSKRPLQLTEAEAHKIFAPATALSLQMQCFYQLGEAAPLSGALAVRLARDEKAATLKSVHAEVGEDGQVRIGEGKPNARWAAVKRDKFVAWYVERLASCVSPYEKPSRLVPRGNMPHRVHVAEDFDNDIERRWWMAGKPETKNLPAGSQRACRGVLTHDFDDLLGNPKAMHTAVVFNPVPGPPMGQNTRLAFRYWLKGTGTLRVQLYSLTNGYHRNLVLVDLPQEKWGDATVDMTAMRRPDGTGGPLSENERIDDIQFYCDPKAELIIDDIVLYDAAPAGEKRPFPKKIHYTAWFDSGKQGKEWPGTFTIVPNKGYFWNAAQSVDNPELGSPWIRLHLRGERRLGETTQLSFRYRLTGAESMRVALVNRTAKATQAVELKGLKSGQWAEVTADFSKDAAPSKPSAGDMVDEIHFLLPKGAELLLDDVLLFEPGA